MPGAHPGPESEERGIAEAIARSIGLMSRLRTPIVTVITGEGGSGGALAIAVGDVVIALENAVYSVISPEGCASILWRTPDEARDRRRGDAHDRRRPACARRRRHRRRPSPASGAHDDPAETARRLKAIVVDRLAALEALTVDELVEQRYRRYRALGAYTEVAQPDAARAPGPQAWRTVSATCSIPVAARSVAASSGWSRDDPPAREEV